MKLFIQNMACIRCMKIVEYELKKLGIKDFTVHSGEAEIRDNISEEQLEIFKLSIQNLGLELIDDKTSIIIEKITNYVFHEAGPVYSPRVANLEKMGNSDHHVCNQTIYTIPDVLNHRFFSNNTAYKFELYPTRVPGDD